MFVNAARAAAPEAAQHAEPFYADPTFWVAVSFVLFVALAVYYKLPGMLAKQLDARAERIRGELDEAKRLREDAQALYAEYQRKAEEAMREADRIVEHAREEAQRVADKARADMEAMLQRRREQAEMKIGQAEQQAFDEVRARAVDIAVAAAADVLKEEMKGKRGAAVIDNAIGDLGKHLH